MDMIVAEEVPYLKRCVWALFAVACLFVGGTDVTQEARYGLADDTQTLP